MFARLGTLHGGTFRLYAQMGGARGVIRGTEVWLDGQKVGVVRSVSFLSPDVDERGRLLVAMDVLDNAHAQIRLNSIAQVRSGGTLIGAPVVYLTIGTSNVRETRDGDTLRALQQSDFETMTSEFSLASREFPDIIANLKVLNAGLHSAQSTLGALGIEKGGPDAARLEAGLARLNAKLDAPRGAIGLALGARGELRDRAKQVMARADSVRALIASDHTSYGRYRRDSTLAREVADIRNEIDIVRARMQSPNGTFGRATADSAIVVALGSVQHEMSLLFADIRRRPLRYVHF